MRGGEGVEERGEDGVRDGCGMVRAVEEGWCGRVRAVEEGGEDGVRGGEGSGGEG